MRTIRVSQLPGVTPAARSYEFLLDGLDLRIPADHRGPDLAYALDPAQEAWLRGWERQGLRETWHCQWAFADRDALERFLTVLGVPVEEPPAPEPAPTPRPPEPPASQPIAPPILDWAARLAAAPEPPRRKRRPAWGVARSWEAIEGWLGDRWPELLGHLAPGAIPAAIADLEVALGHALPADVRESLARHDGQPDGYQTGEVHGVIGNWELLGMRGMLRQWRVWKDLADRGAFASFRPRNDRRMQPVWWHEAWIPLTYDGAGGHHCIDLAPARSGKVGQIFILRPREPDRRVLYPSCRAWLADIAQALTSGAISTVEPGGRREFLESGFLL